MNTGGFAGQCIGAKRVLGLSLGMSGCDSVSPPTNSWIGGSVTVFVGGVGGELIGIVDIDMSDVAGDDERDWTVVDRTGASV